MREAKVILPVFDNDRSGTTDFQGLAEKIAKAFGGVTVVAGLGFDPVQPRGEEVWIYTVAYDGADNDGVLAQLAFEAWRDAGQHFGYIRFADGTVVIVDMADARLTGRIPLPNGRTAAVPGFHYSTTE